VGPSYLELLKIQLKAATLLSLQYRVDFFIQAAMALFWSAISLVPLAVLFSMRAGVAGWTAHEALVVVGFFMVLKGVLVGVIQPSLGNVVEHIRKGTLDFLLLKPVDAQFLLSTSKLDLARTLDVLAGFGVAGWGVLAAGVVPAPQHVLLSVLIVGCALSILYAMWIMVVSLAFYVVKIDNLSYLIVSTFDAARWPSSVFRGALAFVFTFVIPLAVMTTYPALALLGRLRVVEVATAVGMASVFLWLSRRVWLKSVRAYTGAGG
jgi:ABC-2 type transport system permease protein